MNKLKKRFPALVLCLMLAAALLPAQAWAIDPIDLTRDVSLTIQYDYEGKALTGAAFDLYRIADIDEFANATPCGDFGPYDGTITGLENAADWDALAGKLVKYIDENEDILPLLSDAVGEDGTCAFSNLQPGLYLVVGHELKVTKGNDIYTYTCKPFLINLPNREENSDTWDYSVLAEPKAGEPGRESNNVPSPPPSPPDNPPYLPQTGMLWWPVPVMLSAGLLFILIGVLRRRKRTKNEA